jgi:dihydroflavonol-4-reductase
VVLTSSFAAIGYGQPTVREFTEDHWTDPSARVSAYVKSKTLAERAAWDFVSREGGELELAVVNPVAVFGPVLGTEVSASVQILQRLLSGGMPRLANLHFGVVDVRDVADLHFRAMTDPAARSQRFLAVAGDFVSLPQVAALLKGKLGAKAARVPTKTAPDWVVKLAAVFVRSLAPLVPELGKTKNASSAKARNLLGWKPRSAEEALLASAETVFERWEAEHEESD